MEEGGEEKKRGKGGMSVFLLLMAIDSRTIETMIY